MGVALLPADERKNGCTDLTALTVTVVLPKCPKSATVAVALHGYQTCSLALGKEYKLRAVENGLLEKCLDIKHSCSVSVNACS